jgi:hypothetical protein
LKEAWASITSPNSKKENKQIEDPKNNKIKKGKRKDDKVLKIMSCNQSFDDCQKKIKNVIQVHYPLALYVLLCSFSIKSTPKWKYFRYTVFL